MAFHPYSARGDPAAVLQGDYYVGKGRPACGDMQSNSGGFKRFWRSDDVPTLACAHGELLGTSSAQLHAMRHACHAVACRAGVGWAALQTPAGTLSVFLTHLSANCESLSVRSNAQQCV